MTCKLPKRPSVLLVTISLLLIGLPTIVGQDTPKKPVGPGDSRPTMEFRDSFGCPLRFTFAVVVKLEGTNEEFDTDSGCVTEDPTFLAEDYSRTLEVDLKLKKPNWIFGLVADEDGRQTKLVIEGWTDPKTGKFHRVKSIEFDSKDLPKKFWPTIKMPPNL